MGRRDGYRVQNTMDRRFDIPYVGGIKIPFDIPWIGGSISHG
jgi:hypothetical protein